MFNEKKPLKPILIKESNEFPYKNESLFSNSNFIPIPNYSSSNINSKYLLSIDSVHNTDNEEEKKNSQDDSIIIINDENSKRNKRERKNSPKKKTSYTQEKNKEKIIINKMTKSKILKNQKCKENNKGKINKDLTNNSMSELNECYKKMEELISNYPFTQIAKIIIKIINGIEKEDKYNNELYNQIKKITSKIRNKESITMICLAILSSKISLNYNNNNLNTIKIDEEKEEKEKKAKEEKKENDESEMEIEILEDKKESNEIIEIEEQIEEIKKEEKKEDKKKEKKEKRIYVDESPKKIELKINNPVKNKIKEKDKNINNNVQLINSIEDIKQYYSLGRHYYKNKDNKEIYSYKGRDSKLTNSIKFYCSEIHNGCKATCIINKRTNKVKIIGKHQHSGMKNVDKFYKKFSILDGKEWEHIQILNVGDKVKVIIQS